MTRIKGWKDIGEPRKSKARYWSEGENWMDNLYLCN